jgi:hypothetical protein
VVPGGSQNWNIYVNGQTVAGNVANPNNWLIAPANYTTANATSFASSITTEMTANPETGIAGALGTMTGAFVRGGSQDLQRGTDWGIPNGLTVPAFQDVASYHLGLVTSLTDLPLQASELGGGAYNELTAGFNSIVNNLFGTNWKVPNTDGTLGLSLNNSNLINAGFLYGNQLTQQPPAKAGGLSVTD